MVTLYFLQPLNHDGYHTVEIFGSPEYVALFMVWHQWDFTDSIMMTADGMNARAEIRDGVGYDGFYESRRAMRLLQQVETFKLTR